MSAIEAKAHQVALILSEDEHMPRVVAFDPFLLVTIGQIIYQLVKLYQSCGASEETALKRAMNPGIIGRWRMGNIIQSKLRQAGYEHLYHGLKRAIEKSSQQTTVEEMTVLYQEAK